MEEPGSKAAFEGGLLLGFFFQIKLNFEAEMLRSSGSLGISAEVGLFFFLHFSSGSVHFYIVL